jgi:putative SOS response-associated peptidase YedK
MADAKCILQTKPTKKTQDDQRITTAKAKQLMGRHADLKRTDLRDRDSRISPGWYVPVMIWEDGMRAIKPVRYGYRPACKPAFYDVKYPGTYNARCDKLQGFWEGQFGHTHGPIVVNAFHKNVNRPNAKGRELAPGEEVENLVHEFKPRPTQDMLIAFLWSKWSGQGVSDLLSVAATTDEPPAEVAAAGHDRCIVPIKPGHIDEWLNPESADARRLFEILEDRERPYCEHRMAARMLLPMVPIYATHARLALTCDVKEHR